MRLRVVLLSILVFASPAYAELKDYCAAYARDIADLQAPQSEDWQRRYDNAEKACLSRYTPVAAPKREKPVKPKKIARPVVKVAEAPKPVVKKPTVIKNNGRPKEGTPQWVAYCKEKYASFNPKTGTYSAKSGKAKPCLVTRDTVQRE